MVAMSIPTTVPRSAASRPVKARYVRIRKAVSEKKSWIAVREFMVNPTTPESLNFKVESADLDAAMFGFDKNPVTSFRNSGKTSFSVVPGTKAYTMILNVEQNGAVFVEHFIANPTQIGIGFVFNEFVELFECVLEPIIEICFDTVRIVR